MFMHYLEGSGDNWYLNSLKEWHPEPEDFASGEESASCIIIGFKCRCC